MGGEREGDAGSVNGNGGVVGGLHQPAVPAVVAVSSGGAGGGAAGGGGLVEKVKFTVSVRGHQWSSARHVNETLEEFAAAIQRNARRLEFIDEDDCIQRLQLAYSDGSEPEDLDVDATLGDVIICMGDKQLVAIVNYTKPPPAAATIPCNGTTAIRPDTENRSQASPMGINNNIAMAGVYHHKCKTKSDTAPCSYGAPLTTTNNNAADLMGHKFMFPPYNPTTPHGVPSSADPARALKINIPPANSSSLPFQDVDRTCSFHPDYVCERLTGSSLPPLGPSRSNGKVAMCGGKGPGHGGGSSVQFCNTNNNNPTPSPAELANMLVRSSSHPHRMQQPGGGNNLGGNFGGPAQGNRSSSTPPTGGHQSFASALLSRLPMMPNPNLQCPHGATTNIALLAQFLASQLRAFVPPNERSAHPSTADGTHPTHPLPCRENKAAAPSKDTANPSNGPAPPNSSNGQAEIKENTYPPEAAVGTTFENGSPKTETGNVKLSVSGGSHEKDESSSSANMNAAVAPSSGEGVDSEHPNGGSELVFLVNRRSKTGVGTHHLKMSDLSTYFHLSVVDAAKKLGVSQTTLKKACRKFGLKRWPGRKVRSLESTIHGLEHTIAVGQGAGLEELTEAYMRSEVSKLQQEMDQLVHGTPAQHSPAVRTADLYKRLYSRGWRSKYHSPGRHDVDLNAGNNNNNCEQRTTSGLAPGRKPNEATIKLSTNKANQPQQQQPGGTKTAPKLVPCKDEPVQTHSAPHAGSKDRSRNTGRDTGHDTGRDTGRNTGTTKDMDIEGLLREPTSQEANNAVVEGSAVPVTMPVDNGAVVNNCSNNNKKTASGEKPCGDVIVEEKEIPGSFAERSPKRPKRECRIAAEGAAAVRQGLRSSTCAM